MNNVSDQQAKPWYKEFWAWFVFAPLIFIVGVCGVLVTVAYSLKDDVVTDDYYKKGRMINNTFAAERAAADLGLTAEVSFSAQASEVSDEPQAALVTVELTGNEPIYAPVIQLVLSHPMESGLDQSFALTLKPGFSQPSVYQAEVGRLLLGRRYVRLSYYVDGPAEMRTADDPDPKMEAWRLVGEAVIANDLSISLTP